ncbi:MAG: metallophosphatase family protein [Halanaerobiales bacterium]|nr:metallophosphatase family protein [Halanaerobiales bacterium]
MGDKNSIAIISDIHGNYTALNSVLEKINKMDTDISDIMCLGDLVGYNPEPEKSVNKIREVCSKVIAGNHDKAMVGELNTSWFRGSVKKSIRWTQNNLSQSSLDYLSELDTREDIVINGNKIILAHGSPNENAPFTYIFNKFDIQNIEPLIMNSNILFIGHTHIPYCFYNKGDGWVNIDKKEFKINPNYNYIINVGSVGQPRDRDPRSSFVIFDSKKNTIMFKREKYNIEEVQQKFQATDLPESFSLRLKQGR